MGKEGFEQIMGLQAAPMLTGLKAASLLSFHKSKFRDFAGLLAVYEPCFKCKGISIFKVSEGEDYVLLLFYRASALWRDLNRAKAKEILVQCGYRIEDTLQEKLNFLRMRMQIRKSFPHEIGLFLGYPAEDVAGFISHKGHDFCYSGYWKVYVHERETRALFDLYADCTKEFCDRLEHGADLVDLVQAV